MSLPYDKAAAISLALLLVSAFFYYTPSGHSIPFRGAIGIAMWISLFLSLIFGLLTIISMFWRAICFVSVNDDGTMDIQYNNGKREKLTGITRLVARSKSAGGEAIFDWIEIHHSKGIVNANLMHLKGYPEIRKSLIELEKKTKKKIENLEAFKMKL